MGKVALYKNNTLPQEFEIRILSDWWFNNKDEWISRVKQLTTYDLVEPDEPVLAYELACIRWNDGSEVDEVKFNNNNMIIIFRSGKTISISLESADDYAWIIEETQISKNKESWSIICDNGEIFDKKV